MTFLLVLVTGVVVGGFSALFGVGGSVLMVPFMTLVLDYGQHASEGTALLAVVPTAIAGVIAHRRRGYVDFKAAAWLAAGGVTGAFLGARLALEVDADDLKLGFGVFLVAVGLRMTGHGLRRGGGAGEPA